ncbi:MAG: hypothetical protein QXO17_00175 [Nitrososphaerota archaeon]|nr:hypothetical protein [Candidatus Calditenuis fumarioli]
MVIPLAEAESLTFKCYYHPDRFAPRRCGLCGRLICVSCTVLHTSGPVCALCYMRKVLLEEARLRIRLSAIEAGAR